jgi:hypothetical protein
MDLSSLATSGKVAGLGGIGVVLLIRPVVDKSSGVPAAQQVPLLRFIVTGAFGIGALGTVVWLVSGLAGGPTVIAGAGGRGRRAGRDR